MSNFDDLRMQITHEIFDDNDYRLALRGISEAARNSFLSRLLKSEKVVKVRRGLYLFGAKYRTEPLLKYVIASRLYSPSYVSYESALSHHGLIPEAVYVTTSSCFQRKEKNYVTPFGEFSYHFVPQEAFRLGVRSCSSKGGSFLIADPVKALFDLVYLKRRRFESLSDIEGDLRIEASDLKAIVKEYSFAELESLSKSYKKRNCDHLLNLLTREFK